MCIIIDLDRSIAQLDLQEESASCHAYEGYVNSVMYHARLLWVISPARQLVPCLLQVDAQHVGGSDVSVGAHRL